MTPRQPPSNIRLSRHALGNVVAALVLTSGLVLAPPAHARRDGDHERAREAVQAGEVMPLAKLLEQLEREQAGQVLEIELERDEGRWIYEIKLLRADGRLVKRKTDARTGAALDHHGRPTDKQQSGHENSAR